MTRFRYVWVKMRYGKYRGGVTSILRSNELFHLLPHEAGMKFDLTEIDCMAVLGHKLGVPRPITRTA
jgi:hypothetical protein